MMNDELEVCPICGRKASTVDSYGRYRENGIFVSCDHIPCMSYGEFYSPVAWNNMAKREKALKDQLAEKDAEIASLSNREVALLQHLKNGDKLPIDNDHDFERYSNSVNAAYVDNIILAHNEKYNYDRLPHP